MNFCYCVYVVTDFKMTKKEMRSPLELMRKVFPSLFWAAWKTLHQLLIYLLM